MKSVFLSTGDVIVVFQTSGEIRMRCGRGSQCPAILLSSFASASEGTYPSQGSIAFRVDRVPEKWMT